MIYFNQQI